MRFGGRRFLAICVGLASSFFLSGCQVLDMATYEPRTYEVNLGTQNLREELILLNVVRASRFEPLNFTALSKYTASGSMGAGASASKNIGVDFALIRGGSASNAGASPLNTIGATGSTTTGNSFDLSPLDNSDFYQNFLSTLTPQNVNLLVNAGLSREVVFYSVVKAIDVNLTAKGQARAGKYTRLRFFNSPSNNAWHHDGATEAENTTESFEHCERLAEVDYREHHSAPFYADFWLGKHVTDCSFSKFKLLIRAALKYGVTTHAQAKSQKAQQPTVLKIDAKTNLITLPSGSGSGSGASSASRAGLGGNSADQNQDVILCFDPTIAALNEIHMTTGSICPEGQAKNQKAQKSNETLLTQPLTTHLGEYDESMEPILPSAYGVFQFYGELLKTQRGVEISKLAARKTGARELFRVTDDQAGCFVHVNYAGGSYCVPNNDANNTKEVLTLLIALVNLSTTRSTLPYTSSVITNP